MRSFASFLGTTFLLLPVYLTSLNWVSTLLIRTTMLTIHSISKICTWVRYWYYYSSELSPTMWMLISWWLFSVVRLAHIFHLTWTGFPDKRFCRLALGCSGTIPLLRFLPLPYPSVVAVDFGFCNNYCIICIPRVVDHMPPPHLDSPHIIDAAHDHFSV